MGRLSDFKVFPKKEIGRKRHFGIDKARVEILKKVESSDFLKLSTTLWSQNSTIYICERIKLYDLRSAARALYSFVEIKVVASEKETRFILGLKRGLAVVLLIEYLVLLILLITQAFFRNYQAVGVILALMIAGYIFLLLWVRVSLNPLVKKARQVFDIKD